MMTAIEFVKPETLQPDVPLTAQILEHGKSNGVLFAKAGQYGNIIRCVGPLCLTEKDAQKVVQVLDDAVTKFAK